MESDMFRSEKGGGFEQNYIGLIIKLYIMSDELEKFNAKLDEKIK